LKLVVSEEPVAAGSEADALGRVFGVGVVGVEGRDEARQVDQLVGGGEMAGSVELGVE